MASINFNPFESWFHKPPNAPSTSSPSPTHSSTAPPPRNPLPISPPSASPTSSTAPPNPTRKKPSEPEPERPGHYTQMLEQFFWECENDPDYRHAPEVAKILNEDPIFEKENSTEEEVRENERFWKEFRESPVVKFLAQAEKIADMVNELELKENDRPYRDEDKKLWQAVPRVIGPDGRPMPRKAIKRGRSRMTSSGILQGSSFLDFGGSASGPTRPAGLLTLLRLSGISGSKSSIMILS